MIADMVRFCYSLSLKCRFDPKVKNLDYQTNRRKLGISCVES